MREGSLTLYVVAEHALDETSTQATENFYIYTYGKPEKYPITRHYCSGLSSVTNRDSTKHTMHHRERKKQCSIGMKTY